MPLNINIKTTPLAIARWFMFFDALTMVLWGAVVACIVLFIIVGYPWSIVGAVLSLAGMFCQRVTVKLARLVVALERVRK